jgi:4-methyl-5(b-hydroxyethyl)-thiazole monophosphate biosynthesis
MKRVLLLIPHGAEVYETAAFVDVLGWASLEGCERIEVVTAGLQPEVTCTFGLRLLPDALIGELRLDDFDALAIPGGFEEFGFYEEAFSATVGEVIRNFDRRSKPIASVCVGALPVAHSGALTGRCATTYHLGDGRRRRQLAAYGVDVLDQPIVRDGHILTSTAPSTAVDVALELVEILTDRANSEHIRALMGFASH